VNPRSGASLGAGLVRQPQAKTALSQRRDPRRGFYPRALADAAPQAALTQIAGPVQGPRAYAAGDELPIYCLTATLYGASPKVKLPRAAGLQPRRPWQLRSDEEAGCTQ
jgi:hypothetical protein